MDADVDAGAVSTVTRDRRTLVVVEDDADLRDSFAELLRDAGYDVFAVGDGEQALEHLRSNDQLPDMMFVDLAMPGMGGREFRSLQLADPRLAGIPVVFTTGSANLHILDGAPVMQKPFRIDDVLGFLEPAH